MVLNIKSLLVYAFGASLAYLGLLLIRVQKMPDDHWSDEVFDWPPANFQVDALDLGDLKMQYYHAGSKNSSKCIVFFHGFPESPMSWSAYMTHFASRGWHVMAPTLRLFYGSHETTTKPSIQVVAGDVGSLLTEAAPCVKSVLVGHDWGAAVAWGAAVTYPHQVQALVSFNVPHPEVYRRYNLQNIPWTLSYIWYFLFYGLTKPLALWKIRQADYSSFISFWFGSSAPQAYSQAELQAHKDMWKRAMPDMLEWYVMGCQWIIKSLLPSFLVGGETTIMGSIWDDGHTPSTVPTLVLFGDEDWYIDSAMFHKTLHNSLISHPHKRLMGFRASHWLPKERTTECIREMELFLEEIKQE